MTGPANLDGAVRERGALHPLLDASIDCVKAVSLDGRLLAMNPEGMCLMEIEDFSALKGLAWSSLWPEPHRPTLDAAVALAARGSVARFSADCPTAKGNLKHWDVIVSPVHDGDGELASLLVISRDVTREALIAGERALVMRELAHRIANLFTIVDGVIALSARSFPAAKPFVESLRGRISGLSRAVAYVYAGRPLEPEAESYSVHGLLRELLEPYADEHAGAALTISGDDHRVEPAAITPLALVFNELATNALKYGALAHKGGAISVTTARRDGGYQIDWTETGSAAVTKPDVKGFGTTLLDRTVMVQLGATLERDWRPQGLAVRIVVPLSRLTA